MDNELSRLLRELEAEILKLQERVAALEQTTADNVAIGILKNKRLSQEKEQDCKCSTS